MIILVEKEKYVFKNLTNWTQELKTSSINVSTVKKSNKKNKVKIPHPFLKWAGGKRQLLPQIKEFIPHEFKNYIEPFVGGGALFFHLYCENLINYKTILIDINPDLINCYNVIKNNVFELIESLKKHKNDKDYYYCMRNVDLTPEFKKWTKVEKASRIIFMNRCCFNGLYRVNSKGHFNVPFGKYKNPNFCNEENLLACQKALENVEILNNSFEICLKFGEKDDFIYFDPPYVPISDSANFTSYTKNNFGIDDQKKLYHVFKELDERGCYIILSNSYCNFILDLYKEFNIYTLKAKRAINSDASKRGEIKELLILNYKI